MKIKTVKLSNQRNKKGVETAADTSKHDYVVRVKTLLEQHDHPGCQSYISRATKLFEDDPDSESMLPLILSA